MKKALYIIVISILSIIIIFNLCSMFNISLFHYRVFKVATGSMEPNYKIGDIVLVKDNSKYKVGDVITYKYGNSYVTHRIVHMKKDVIVTRGDANNTNDAQITKKDVVGKVICKLGFLSIINLLIGMPGTWICILVVGLIIIIVLPSYKRKNGKIIDKEII